MSTATRSSSGREQGRDDSLQTTIVLLVSDQAWMRAAFCRALETQGYAVDFADGYAATLAHFNPCSTTPNVVVLATTANDTLALCRAIRERSEVPVMIVTKQPAVADRVAGLNAGADDCLSSPVAAEELIARVSALVRRAGLPLRALL